MKIYITGSVGSGKSTYAEKLSQVTGIECTHLDEVMYEDDPASSWGNRKRPIEVRDAMFAEVLARDSYIMEDAGRKCFSEGMFSADKVILIEPSFLVVRKRILFRWLKQRLGIEKCIYKPKFAVLKAMLKWSADYRNGTDDIRTRLNEFSDKVIVLRTNRDLKNYLSSLKECN